MPRRRPTVVAAAAVVALLGGCSEPPTERELVSGSCRELQELAEPFERTSDTPPFDLLRPTTPPDDWRDSGERMQELAEPLRATRFAERFRSWEEAGRYLVEASEDPDSYDPARFAPVLWSAGAACADSTDEVE